MSHHGSCSDKTPTSPIMPDDDDIVTDNNSRADGDNDPSNKSPISVMKAVLACQKLRKKSSKKNKIYIDENNNMNNTTTTTTTTDDDNKSTTPTVVPSSSSSSSSSSLPAAAPPQHPKTDLSTCLIESALRQSFIFDSISYADCRDLVAAMSPRNVPSGTIIIQQGYDTTNGDDDYFYVIDEGIVDFIVDGTKTRSLCHGDFFGELALLYDYPRSATCIASADCLLWTVDGMTFRNIISKNHPDDDDDGSSSSLEDIYNIVKRLTYDCPHAALMLSNAPKSLWKMDRRTFRSTLARIVYRELEDVYEVLHRLPCLLDLNKDTLIKMMDALTIRMYAAGDVIVTKGDVWSEFIIIREGKAKRHDCDVIRMMNVDYNGTFVEDDDNDLRMGDYLGESSLLRRDQVATMTVTAVTKCEVLSLTIDDLELCLGGQTLLNAIESAKDENRLINQNILLDLPLFATTAKKLEPCYITRMADIFQNRMFQEGEFLMEVGRPIAEDKQGVYIVKRGHVVITDGNNGNVRSLGEGDHFGDDCFQSAWFDEDNGSLTATMTVFFESCTVCAVLTKTLIERTIGRTLSRLDQQLTFDDMETCGTISAGSYSRITVVRHKTTTTDVDDSSRRLPYTLKEMNKKKAVKENKIDNIAREINIMTSFVHPFVANLITTMRGDDGKIYLLYDFFCGGHLKRLIQSQHHHPKKLPNDHARFYAACILHALSHIHKRNICHRNIALENIIIGKDGYAALTNFSLAKVVLERTYTFCGSPEYMAPEMLLRNKGYDKSIDYWAFGIILCEMLLGVNPFQNKRRSGCSGSGNSRGINNILFVERIAKRRASFTSLRMKNSLENNMNGDADVCVAAAKELIVGLFNNDPKHRIGCGSGGASDIRHHLWLRDVEFDELATKSLPAPWIPELDNKNGDFDGRYFDVQSNDPSSSDATAKEEGGGVGRSKRRFSLIPEHNIFDDILKPPNE